MTTREASIKLTLNPGTFQSGLRRLESGVKASGKRMGQAFRGPMTAGLRSAKAELGSMMGTLKNGVKTVAALGGAASFAALAKDAIGMQNTYRNIAFNVNKVAGNAMEWSDVQKMVAESVRATGRNAEELSTAFMTVFEATGSFEEAKTAMNVVGTTATATGHTIDALANVMQLSSRKFGVGADRMDEAMARFVEKTGVGGKGLEDMSNRFALVAGEAAGAGMAGEQGISDLLGLMLLLDSSIGEKADPGLKMMFQTVKSGSSQFVALKKAMGRGMEFNADMTAMEKIKATLTSTKGRSAAELIFTADARVVYDELAKPFDKAMEDAKERGLSKADALKAGLAAFDANLRKSSQSTMKYSKIQQEAANRADSDPLVKFNLALARVKEAMVQPAMIEAFDKLADKLPAFADGVAAVITHIVDNPWSSIATVVGGRIALAFAGSAVSNAVATGMTALLAKTAAVSAAGTAGAALTTAGGVATGAGALGAGALALGAGAAAAFGGAVGLVIREVFNTDEGTSNNLGAVRDSMQTRYEAERTLAGGSAESKQKALEQVQASLKNISETQDMTEDLLGALTGSSGAQDRVTAQTELKQLQAELKKSIKLMAQEATARAKNTKGVEKSTRATNDNTKSKSTRGVKDSPDTEPGADDKG